MEWNRLVTPLMRASESAILVSPDVAPFRLGTETCRPTSGSMVLCTIDGRHPASLSTIDQLLKDFLGDVQGAKMSRKEGRK